MRATPSTGVIDDRSMPWWDYETMGFDFFIEALAGLLAKILFALFVCFCLFALLLPFSHLFSGEGLAGAQRTKAQQDLDVIRNAILLHDSQQQQLEGGDLTPLLGRYLQELPKDPWGNPYFFDANLGIALSFGADEVPGGTGGDSDHIMTYKSPLRPIAASLEHVDNETCLLHIRFNKALEIVDECSFLSSFSIVDSPRMASDLSTGDLWKVASNHEQSDWLKGKVVLLQHNASGTISPIGKLQWTVTRGSSIDGGGIRECLVPKGSLNPKIFGDDIKTIYRRAISLTEPLTIELIQE